MAKTYLVSKSGLTRCPACERHIFLAEDWKETDCSFCGMHLVSGDAPGVSGIVGVSRPGRSGLIAAGLLSMSLSAAGCVDDAETEKRLDQGVMGGAATMPMGGSAAMGGTPTMGGEKVSPDAALAQPVYGAPGPEPVLMPDASMEADMELDQPVYGAPGPDAEVMLDAAAEPEPQPEYGAPPEEG